MKSIQSLFTRYLAIIFILSIGITGLFAYSGLEDLKIELLATTGLSSDTLFFALFVVLLAVFATIYLLLQKHISKPLNNLLTQAETNHYFGAKPHLGEIKRFRSILEGQALKISEFENQVDDFEANKPKTQVLDRDSQTTPARTPEPVLDESELDALKTDNQKLQSLCEKLEYSLDAEKKSKFEGLIESRTGEIYEQMKKAFEESASKAVTRPSISHELLTPAYLIKSVVNRLTKSWQDISITRINEDIAEIARQNEAQLALLEELEKKDGSKG